MQNRKSLIEYRQVKILLFFFLLLKKLAELIVDFNILNIYYTDIVLCIIFFNDLFLQNCIRMRFNLHIKK